MSHLSAAEYIVRRASLAAAAAAAAAACLWPEWCGERAREKRRGQRSKTTPALGVLAPWPPHPPAAADNGTVKYGPRPEQGESRAWYDAPSYQLAVPPIFQLLDPHLAAAAALISDAVPLVISLIVTDGDAPTSRRRLRSASRRALPQWGLVFVVSKNQRHCRHAYNFKLLRAIPDMSASVETGKSACRPS